MSDYKTLKEELGKSSRTWLVTGAAGFIGSHLAETLLGLGQTVRGLDDLSYGEQSNIDLLSQHENFTFIKGDTRDLGVCEEVCAGVDYILHHAAIGSVIKSVEDPVLADSVNNGGFINILLAAHKAGVPRIVYASSSAIYGNGVGEPRHEGEPFDPLSPYAVSKCANELYAKALSETHGLSTVGLRYFNIYGPRQNPNGAYAAVIPKWIHEMIVDQDIEIYGDGKTIRDFCYIDDAVQANLRATLVDMEEQESRVYNVAGGRGISLIELYSALQALSGTDKDAVFKEFRAADIRKSSASITLATDELGFVPTVGISEGLRQTYEWYKSKA